MPSSSVSISIDQTALAQKRNQKNLVPFLFFHAIDRPVDVGPGYTQPPLSIKSQEMRKYPTAILSVLILPAFVNCSYPFLYYKKCHKAGKGEKQNFLS